MTENIYNPDCSRDDDQQQQFEQDDGKECRITCLVCGTIWIERLFGGDIECPKCGPADPPEQEPLSLHDDIWLDFWSGVPIDKVGSHD